MRVNFGHVSDTESNGKKSDASASRHGWTTTELVVSGTKQRGTTTTESDRVQGFGGKGWSGTVKRQSDGCIVMFLNSFN